MYSFFLFLIGVLIGTAMIVPGVSGAVIAVIFGVYDKMIESLINLFKEFKKNFMFLFILGLGILVGAIWFSNVMMFLYNRHEVITKLSFIGLILGGIPYLFKTIKDKNENVNYLALFITFLSSFILWTLSNNVFKLDLDAENTSLILSFFNLFLAGIIYSIGKVFPGISGSFLLITIGMYEYVLSVIAHPITVGLKEIGKLLPFLLGLIAGIVVLLKIMNYLLKKHFGLIYSVIIGFVIGSVPVLIPGFNLSLDYGIGIIIMILCFTLSYKLMK